MKPNASETWNPTPVQAFHGSRKRIEFDMTPLLVPEFTLRRNTDGSIEVICLRCLEKRAAERYPSAECLADDLRSLLGRGN